MFSQIKDTKHIRQGFCWGVKNFSVGICDGAPLTAHSSFSLISHENDVIWSIATKLFHFHKLFKNGGWEGVQAPLDLPLCYKGMILQRNYHGHFPRIPL